MYAKSLLGVDFFGKPSANWFAYARGGLGFDAAGEAPVLVYDSAEQATNLDFMATLWAANLNVTHNTVAYRAIPDGVIVRQELANANAENRNGFIPFLFGHPKLHISFAVRHNARNLLIGGNVGTHTKL